MSFQNRSSRLICSLLNKVPYNAAHFSISNINGKSHQCQSNLGVLVILKVKLKNNDFEYKKDKQHAQKEVKVNRYLSRWEIQIGAEKFHCSDSIISKC